MAEECFKLLEERKNEKNKPPALITIKNKDKSYEFDKTNVIVTDISNIYNNDKLNIKISKAANLNSLLKNEVDVLKKIAGDSNFNHYLPQLIDNFTVVLPTKVNLQANIFQRLETADRYFSLEQIKEKYPNIDGRNVAWMLNRLFEVISYIHTKGIIHANITPQNFIVDIQSKPPEMCHGGILLNWENSAELGQNARFINKKYEDFFPVEIKNKQPISYETDIYMIGKLAKWLCQDFSQSIDRFLDSLIISRMRYRPDNCFDLYQEFKELLRKNYGKAKFVTLE